MAATNKSIVSPRTPPVWLDWPDACKAVRSIPNTTRHSRRDEVRLIASIALGGTAAHDALHAGAQRLRSDLAARNVLCDEANPCDVMTRVEGDGSWSVRACVPKGAPAPQARLCDPWGLDFQQTGGVLDQIRRPTTMPGSTRGSAANTLGGASQAERLSSGLTNGNACVDVNLTQLAAWWTHHRKRRPFLDASHPGLKQYLHAKAYSASKTRPTWPTTSQLATLHRMLNTSLPGGGSSSTNQSPHYRRPRAATPRSKSFDAQSMRRCAFVGSGHDLRCGLQEAVRSTRCSTASSAPTPPSSSIILISTLSIQNMRDGGPDFLDELPVCLSAIAVERQ